MKDGEKPEDSFTGRFQNESQFPNHRFICIPAIFSSSHTLFFKLFCFKIKYVISAFHNSSIFFIYLYIC